MKLTDRIGKLVALTGCVSASVMTALYVFAVPLSVWIGLEPWSLRSFVFGAFTLLGFLYLSIALYMVIERQVIRYFRRLNRDSRIRERRKRLLDSEDKESARSV